MDTNKELEKSDVARREEEILAFWNEHDIFNKSVLKDAPNGDFVFYDGPPFATGTPHYGHLLGGTLKDTIPRFWTMNGYRVQRKWGWDCHGLPLENIIEKRLGLATKRDIEEFGVQKFNEAARDAVLEYEDYWKVVVPRMGRFVDMEHAYKTMDASYTESVWWVFGELNRKGLVYEGFKSMHLCPRCGTTLSNFEVNQGYKDIKDISVTVKLQLLDDGGNSTDTSLLVWTTTPWTLPGNMAAAVHNDIEYVKVAVTSEGKEEKVILAKARLVQLGTEEYTVLETIKGSDLVGKSYQPPFGYMQEYDVVGKENAWKIYHADYVELGEEGTGAVHIAPAYGEDDLNLAKSHDVPVVHHVDHDGRFMPFVTDFAGQLVKPKDDDASGVTHLEADIKILKHLQEKGSVFKKENITHSYPHCWRCDTPLINYATTSWFVRVTDLKDRLVAANNTVKWVPEHVGRARFGNWLEGARDWAISRQRYWGAPLPIWRNKKTKAYKVFSSLAELKQYVPKSGNKYYAMRHGESESNLTFTIRTDVSVADPLTEKGVTQVRDSAEKLKSAGIDMIIVSPFSRTRETAEIVREVLGLSQESVVTDDRLKEINVGEELQGKSWKEYVSAYASFEDEYTTHPSGVTENRRDVQTRVGEFLFEIEQKYQGKTILVVGHNSSMFGFASAAEGVPLAQAHEFKRGFWLENAEVREVAFTPYPHNDVYELDFHRPYIDTFIIRDEDGEEMERVLDVFDCWFESGSMPYAQNHYPFENLDTFNAEKGLGFPAQFIAEGLDQTRGWFYSLIVLGTALFDKSPFEHVIVNGIVLAEDGKKMSKSLNNYPDPMELAGRVGVDAIRYCLLSSPAVRGEDLSFSEKEVLELQRKNLGRLHNVLAMYEMFADATVSPSTKSENVLDRWMIARLNEATKQITEGYTNYELDKATRPIADIIDDISVWYLRRSRDRLKSDDQNDKHACLATLRHTLKTLSLLMAPVMPFYAEYLFLRVREENDAESVHLALWPKGGDVDPVVLGEMSIVREFVTAALELRTKANIKVRQPLATLFTNIEIAPEYASIVAEEINVKSVTYDSGMEDRVRLDENITSELKREGDVRELMRAIQDARKQMGLQAEDRITLLVDEGTKTLIASFEKEVLRTTGSVEARISEVTDRHITIDGETYSFGIEK